MIELNKTYPDQNGDEWRIICVDKEGDYPIVAVCGETARCFTFEGQFELQKKGSRDLILPEDFRTYKIDEPVMVRDHDEDEWLRRYFAGVKDDTPCAWTDGTTSWSVGSMDEMIVWNQCRRPTKEELEK